MEMAVSDETIPSQPRVYGEPPDQMVWGDRVEAYGVSQDGSMVRITLTMAPDGSKMWLTMPAGNLPAYIRDLQGLLARVREQGGAQPDVAAPQSWLVGRVNDPRMKDQTVLMFDKGTPQEKVVMLPDVQALGMADAIEEQVYKSLKPEERRIIDAARKAKQKPKIIQPGDINFGLPPRKPN